VVAFTNTRCPAEPLNDNTPFWPRLEGATETAAPPGVIESVTSAGTSYNVIVVVPVAFDQNGSIRTEYVPLVGNVTASTYFVSFEPIHPVEPSSPPPASRILTL